MANKFGARSEKNLEKVHPYLEEICRELLKYQDAIIVYGARTIEQQTDLVAKGLSQTMNSMHLIQYDGFAHAVDMCPYPIDWNNTKRFYWMAGMMEVIAKDLLPEGWYLRWGGNWDRDEDLDDQTFMDLAHFEIRVRSN